uniref:Uncharacterized protein n=1 Tax=Magallana gigas TaxID=29159 RepID=K1QKD7_MAGGI
MPKYKRKSIAIKATSPGAIIGAAFGGAQTFFGKKIPVRQINDENQQTSSRDLNTKSVVYNEINDDLQRVVQTMQQQEASGIKEGVYNHLHSADQKDRSDYYDHAGPSFINIEEGYGVLSLDSKSNGNYIELSLVYGVTVLQLLFRIRKELNQSLMFESLTSNVIYVTLVPCWYNWRVTFKIQIASLKGRGHDFDQNKNDYSNTFAKHRGRLDVLPSDSRRNDLATPNRKKPKTSEYVQSSDHGFPLLSSSRTRSPTRATYPTTTCSCPSPIPCPSPTVCPVTKCPTVTRYPVITPCPSPKPCPAVTANPSTSVCRCPAFPLADCSKCTTLTTQTVTCPECSGIKAQNVILSSEDPGLTSSKI